MKTRSLKLLLIGVGLCFMLAWLALLSVFAPSAHTASGQSSVLGWQIETVDSAPVVGKYNSLALDAAGRPHISYYDGEVGGLRYARRDGSAWSIQAVDGIGTKAGQHTSLALDSAGRPHISYHDGTSLDLKYAYHDGSAWITDAVDQGGFWGTSLALDSAGRPHISYDDFNDEYVLHTYGNGSTWNIEWAGDYRGYHPSLALDAADRPHLSYYAVYHGALQYAHHDGANWQVETVDSAGTPGTADTGGNTSLALDAAGRPHIGYFDDVNDDLKYAYYNGSSWITETVDSAGVVGLNASLALDAAGRPHIGYYDATNQALKYAYHDGAAWQIEIVANAGGGSGYISLALDALGQPHISYYDNADGVLKYASDVSLGVHRRAAQHLEEMRGTGMAPGWETALLGAGVRPLYRPDVQGVAYYDFPVVLPPEGEPAGYNIVSTGDHDYPIPHWAFSGQSPTQRLAQTAAISGQVAAKFYKLDALAYAAENAAGEQVATLGQQPPRISGMDPAWLDEPPELTESMWIPSRATTDDTNAHQISGTLVISGPAEPPPSLGLGAWGSWEELKAGYSDSYGVLAEARRRNASQQWEAQAAISQYGQPLFKGDVYDLPLLWQTEMLSLSGDGVGYVQTEWVTREGLPPVFRIAVLDSSLGKAIPLTVTISYPNGVTESVGFIIVAPVYHQVWLPMIVKDAGPAAPTSSGQAIGAQDTVQAQGSWSYYWVGPNTDQCWYQQIKRGYPPNDEPCWSGCGATAWAMLFCWVDNQARPAAGNSYWGGRWGLYRVDGGRGADDVAIKSWGYWNDPLYKGVRAMTWEIRNDIDTFCYAGSGATGPWNMEDVSSYVSGRSAVSVRTKYNSVGYGEDRIRNYAIRAIKGGGESEKATPAIIGTGWLSHYPLAYGYRSRSRTYCVVPEYRIACVVTHDREFFVNQGWGGSDGEWVEADTWFAGRVMPHTNWVDDVAVYRPANRKWYYDHDHDGDTDETGEPWRPPWDSEDALPFAGDFDRDTIIDDVALYNQSTHKLYYSYDHDGSTDEWGAPFRLWSGDDLLPLAGDFDRDGFVDDIALYSPTTFRWYYSYDHDSDTDVWGDPWGIGGGLPVAGDFDRDGFVDDVAIYSPSDRKWYFDHDHDGDTADEVRGPWGINGDLPVAGDFDRDGFVDDVALFRSSEGKWYFDHDHNGNTDAVRGPWGLNGDLPLAGTFDIY